MTAPTLRSNHLFTLSLAIGSHDAVPATGREVGATLSSATAVGLLLAAPQPAAMMRKTAKEEAENIRGVCFIGTTSWSNGLFVARVWLATIRVLTNQLRIGADHESKAVS